MRIERVDDKTVKCFLTKEELDEYEITYKDFLLRSDKAREVMEQIMVHAEEEVGFQPPGFAFELQIMVLPDEGMILTFSEKDMEELQIVKDAKGCLGVLKAALEENGGDLAKALEAARAAIEAKGRSDGGEAVDQEKEAPLVTFAVFSFPCISDICAYAKLLPGNLRVESVLYEMNGVYYLYLDKGKASYERYSRACIRAMEYGSLYTADQGRLAYIREHAQCLLPDHALKKLRF